MSDDRRQESGSDKRRGPIVQASGRAAGAQGRVRRAGSRRQARIAIFVVVFVAAVIVGGYFLLVPRDRTPTISGYSTALVSVRTLQDTVELSGAVTARTQAAVTAQEAGTMGTLFVDEGDWVSKGQLVAILETEDLGDQLAALELQLERSQRDFDRFLLQHEYDLRSYTRQRQKLVNALADANEELADTRELYDLGSASRSEVEQAVDQAENAAEAVEDHDAEVEEALAIHELNRSNYEDDLLTVREDITDLRERIADARVISPITGRVISIAEAATTYGERIQQYQTLMEIADARNPLIETSIDEQYAGLLSPGQPVAVDLSGTRVAGAVERIGLTAVTPSDGGTPTVDLDVAVDVGDAEYTIGTSTIVEVLIGEIPDAVVLPRGPFLTSGSRKYVYRVDGPVALRTEVTYGAITDDAVQILSGLGPGDMVITSSYTGFIDSDTVMLGGIQ